MGFRLPDGQPGSESDIQDPAAWAEFFVPDLGWIPVDPADAQGPARESLRPVSETSTKTGFCSRWEGTLSSLRRARVTPTTSSSILMPRATERRSE